ncbi:transmembrane and coiled-coil domain containing protein, putative [Entamoeba invadens IP1]|uniref:transmembrane and coiled-coil domain containing protein, putative n=1 Tax=Entamoeba invadens IP1 TaxID=370355 RepID=UPI0002C3DEFC|nr:transmembrane and coiled-coil domain containing protein, putative [Entamoeba invadens IP1]ELP90517.1 transmembrane and coiled-coil domain containing protein, putative [Entamoeba invadens IP1]|eukprot:XP_004257288.1 transmembrane and coiled-coil domain containing protein, putative [Entamoeba invadens IP1]
MFIQLVVTGYSFLCALLSEYITKYFVTGNTDYLSYVDALEKIDEKLAKLGGYENKKKIDKLNKDKEDINQKIAFIKFKPMILNVVIMIVSTILVNYLFDPQPVGILPFEPFGFFTRVTHRNLPGENMQECSIFFFFILTRMTLKPICAQLFGNDNVNEASFMNAFIPNSEAFKSE